MNKYIVEATPSCPAFESYVVYHWVIYDGCKAIASQPLHRGNGYLNKQEAILVGEAYLRDLIKENALRK